MRIRRILICLLTLVAAPLLADVPYTVHISGVSDPSLIETLETISLLETLKDQPPQTMTALKRRAESDVENLKIGLQSKGYYSPEIDLELCDETTPVHIEIHIDPGHVYPLVSVEIVPSENDPGCFDYSTISPGLIGLCVGDPALPKAIIDSEVRLWHIMADSGFPLAAIEEKLVIADVECETVSLKFSVNSGPICYFSWPTIEGHCKVNQCFIEKQIVWRPGQLYDQSLVDETQHNLEGSGLFNAVTMTTGNEFDEDGYIPLVIHVEEGKHRTIGFGVSYNTQQGPGFNAEWQHRNMFGLGNSLTFESDIWWEKQRGTLLYRIPDFKCRNQDFLVLTELEREETKGFTEKFFSVSGLIENHVCDNFKFSYGLSFKQLDSEDSDENGSFSLLKVPLIASWSNANDLLDPTYGITLHARLTPTVSLLSNQFAYFINTFTGSCYYPMTRDHRFVLAGKATFGSIFGASRRTIPPPERFYLGTENTLRGYRYKTVSPLSPTNKPLGGRSMMAYALEVRVRTSDTIGWVFFYEIGNTYSQILPQFTDKQLQSAGVGFRYHTPVGPLRLDVAVPLDKRRGLDRAVQFYISIGQAF